jgi:hypothetical protein
MSSVFNIGPIAPERNPRINPQYYSPTIYVLQSIAAVSDFLTQVVTVKDNNFSVGQIIRFSIPYGDGMQQLNGQQATVMAIFDPTTFYVDISVIGSDAFNPLGNLTQDPFVIPIGDINSGSINSSGRINNLLYIDGSFKNISPQ